METTSSEVTQLIRLAESGATGARERLFEVLYSDLRRLAASRMAYERCSHTLTATALVHESYLRLVEGAAASCRDRGHFFAVASQAMRRILVDHARKRNALKRSLDVPSSNPVEERDEVLLALDQALTALHELSPRQCQVVELRYFGGLTEDQVAETLNVTRRTINRDWKMARAWLHARLSARGIRLES